MVEEVTIYEIVFFREGIWMPLLGMIVFIIIVSARLYRESGKFDKNVKRNLAIVIALVTGIVISINWDVVDHVKAYILYKKGKYNTTEGRIRLIDSDGLLITKIELDGEVFLFSRSHLDCLRPRKYSNAPYQIGNFLILDYVMLGDFKCIVQARLASQGNSTGH